MENNRKVKVIDSMMGTGKTSYAIQMMNTAPKTQKFIFVTPILDEVKRIKEDVTNHNFTEPDTTHGQGKKLESLKKLIASGADIVTTHALFAMADKELMELLQWENYTLILDEVMEVLAILDTIKQDDIATLKDTGLISVDEATHQVFWTGKPDYNARYNDVKQYALSGNLYEVNGTAFLWNFPAKIFNLFSEVYILTYLFDGQIQKYYYDLHGIQYDYYAVVKSGQRYELKPKHLVPEDRSHLKALINIYDDKLNNIGDKKTALSKNWFISSHNKVKVKRLQDNLYNYFRNIQKASANEILWTTFKGHKDNVRKSIQGNGFSKTEPKTNANSTVGKACFIPFTTRATNKYKHKTVLAFCLNRFMNPLEEHFFDQNNVKVDEDLLALSDMLQWIFRSAIREGKPINIYIPSKRMRTLLKQWLDNEI
jgi:hypothetical protein